MFAFKQFVIRQSDCAMKVGTDGVLLGAWADVKNARSVLDVGSGTGLIALMMAQRNAEAEIFGIELDEKAANQARENVVASPWKERVSVVCGDFCTYNFARKFDLIVSNPPYFVRSLKNPDKNRELARHSDALPAEKLAWRAAELLSENGRLAVIYPLDEAKTFLRHAEEASLFPCRQTLVRTKSTAASKRVMLEFCRQRGGLAQNELVIETGNPPHFSDEYISLTKDFYLKM